jgi:phage FluMu protein Com
MGRRPRRIFHVCHRVGDGVPTTLSDVRLKVSLTDAVTSCKAPRCKVVRSITIKEDRFGFEPAITGKLARARCRIYKLASPTRTALMSRASGSTGRMACARFTAF